MLITRFQRTLILLTTAWWLCPASTAWSEGKYQFINKDGQPAFQMKLDGASSFREGRAVVYNVAQKYFLIDKTGKRISDSHRRIWDMTDNMAKYSEREDGAVGFLNRNGKVGITPSYKFAYPFSNGLARVTMNDLRKEVFIDKNGKVVLVPEFPTLDFNDERARIIIEAGKVGYIDKSGAIAIAPNFQDGKKFSNGLAIVKRNQRWGWIDRSGKIVIEAQFDECRDFSENLGAVRIKNKWGFVDKTGTLKIPCIYENEPLSFHDGRSRIKENGKVSYIDTSGKVVIHSTNFDNAYSFSDGVARATKIVPFHEGFEERTGFIDVQGKWVIPPKFDEAEDFSEGLAVVKEVVEVNHKIQAETQPLPNASKWLLHTFSDYRKLLEMTFSTTNMVVMRAGGRSFQAKYSMEPISLSDPGLRGFGPSFVPNAKMRIFFRGKSSLWAVRFGSGNHLDAYKMYWPASGSDPWGFMLNTERTD